MVNRLSSAKKGLVTLVALATFIGVGGFFNNNKLSCDCNLPTLPTYGLTNWKYNPGIEKQKKDASPELLELLNCMAPKLSKEGTIASISDSAGMEHCQDNYDSSCAHGKNSAHYGCRDKYSGSLAVDILTEGNGCELATAAYDCGARKAFGPRSSVKRCNLPSNFFQADGHHEGHLHISVDAPRGYHKCN